MKYAIVTDTHLSVRNDLESLAQHQNHFWEHVFFPILKERGINQILHLGDFFDKRQFVTVKSMHNLQDVFLKLLEDYDCKMDLIVGNHDILYRNTVDFNAPSNMFNNNQRINVITKPTKIENILMVPWIAKNNAEECFDAMEKTDALYCFGHFEIAGFELHKGQVAESGLDKKIFLKFHKVLSGHFHTRSQNGNIIYVGSPFEMTWNDYNDMRGFHIFDTETGDLEFIPYEESMFFKVEYDNDNHFWQPYKPKSLTGKFVKVIVKNKDSLIDFEHWVKKLQSYVPNEFQIYESTIDINGIEIEMENAEKALSNIEIIQQKINAIPEDSTITKQTKAFINNYMTKLYNESNVLI